MHSIVDAVMSSWFEATDPTSEEVVLLKILQVLLALINLFEREYGNFHPAFQIAGFMDALGTSRKEFKLSFVYLHSSERSNMLMFCQDTLCSEVVVEYINQNFVSWGGNVRFNEGFKMRNNLKASTFPFLCYYHACDQPVDFPSTTGWGPKISFRAPVSSSCGEFVRYKKKLMWRDHGGVHLLIRVRLVVVESWSSVRVSVLALQDDLQVRGWTRLMKSCASAWMILGDCMHIIIGPHLLKIGIDGIDGTAVSGFRILWYFLQIGGGWTCPEATRRGRGGRISVFCL